MDAPDCVDTGYGFCGTVFSLDMGLGPFVTFAHAAGKVGQTGPILGQGFTGTTSVALNGIPASFTGGFRHVYKSHGSRWGDNLVMSL